MSAGDSSETANAYAAGTPASGIEGQPRRRVRSFDEHRKPRIAGELNGEVVKLAKVEGEFVWHQYEDADERFLVHSGTLSIGVRECTDIELETGAFVIVPRGVEHRPGAESEAEILVVDPTETRNTGNVESDGM